MSARYGTGFRHERGGRGEAAGPKGGCRGLDHNLAKRMQCAKRGSRVKRLHFNSFRVVEYGNDRGNQVLA